MSSYIIAGLGLLAAWFYALYQRSKRQRAEVEVKEAKKQLTQAQADEVAQRVRYEALVADLKQQLKALEDTFDAFATPDALRARFRELFPRAGEAHTAGSVSPSPAPSPGAGGADGLSGG